MIEHKGSQYSLLVGADEQEYAVNARKEKIMQVAERHAYHEKSPKLYICGSF